MSTIRSQIVTLFIAVTLPLAAVGFIFASSIVQQSILTATQEKLSAVAAIQERRVTEAVNRYISNTQLLASRNLWRESVYNSVKNNTSLDDIRTSIRSANASELYIKDVYVWGTTGNLITTTDLEPEIPQNIEQVVALGTQGVRLIDLYKDSANVLLVQVAAPVIWNNETVGVLEVEFFADGLIAITEDYTGLGETGEVIIVREDTSRNVQYLHPLRYNSNATLEKTDIGDDVNVPLLLATSGREGVLSDSGIVDYRRQEILSQVSYIDALGWGLVAKIDRSEVFTPLYTLGYKILILIVIFYSAATLMWLFLSRRITNPLKALTDKAQEMAHGQLQVPVDLHRNDEIGELASSLDIMRADLRKLYAGLESEVDKKTVELSQAYDQVQDNNDQLEKTKEALLNVLEDLENEKAELRQANLKDEAILSNLGEGLVVTDENRTIIVINQAALKMIGRQRDDVVGNQWPEIQGIENDEDYTPPIIQALEKETTVTVTDAEYLHSNGTRFPVAITASPFIMDKQIVGGIVIFRDITQEREIDKAKTELVSLASHQLRTPLTSVSWFTELLLSGDAGTVTDEQKEYLQDILHENQRMVSLVNALLDVSRIDMGTFRVEPEEADIVDIAKSLVKSVQPIASESGVGLEATYEEIPRMQLDVKLMSIVIENLLSNAIKYSLGKGTVRLSVQREEDSVLLQVADEGIGIPLMQQNKIFTKLFRADNVKANETTGTGLGLYIAKAIIDYSGGEIYFESEEGKGTTFFVRIPLSGMKPKKGTRAIGS